MAASRKPAALPPRQVNFRLPADVWQRVDAAARAFRLSQSRIVADALKLYFAQLSSEDRQLIDRLMLPRPKS